MKLIDLLVQELPKRGGWPQGSGFIAADEDGAIDSYVNKPVLDKPSNSWVDNQGDGYHEANVLRTTKVCDWDECFVSRSQYEAALAASKQVAWDGCDLPTEGIECEVKSGKDSWTLCRIVHSSSAGVAFIYLEEPNGCASYLGVLDCISAKAAGQQFRPMRTEADCKREDCCDKIFGVMCKAERKDNRSDMAEAIYDAIAAGEIPGVKLAD